MDRELVFGDEIKLISNIVKKGAGWCYSPIFARSIKNCVRAIKIP
jgi:hypothetical protein